MQRLNPSHRSVSAAVQVGSARTVVEYSGPAVEPLLEHAYQRRGAL